MIVWFCDTAIAVDDGTGIATVSLTDKRWRQPDAEFTPSLGLYVGAVGALKASPVDSYLHMAGWRVLDLQYVFSDMPRFLCRRLALAGCREAVPVPKRLPVGRYHLQPRALLSVAEPRGSTKPPTVALLVGGCGRGLRREVIREADWFGWD